jgi:hypothetical protein
MKQITVAENVKITNTALSHKQKMKNDTKIVSLYSRYKVIPTTFVSLHVRDEEPKME